MKKRSINLAFSLLGLIGSLSLYQKLKSRKRDDNLGILTYHEIDPNQFEKHLKFLINRYKIISIHELYDFISNNDIPKYPSLVLTFDDGSIQFYTDIYPILKKYEIPVLHYIVTGGILEDKNFEFWWKKVKRLKKLGAEISVNYLKTLSEDVKSEYINSLSQHFGYNDDISDVMTNSNLLELDQYDFITFGAHTVNHPCLTKISLEEAKNEIINSKKHLENLLNHKIEHFAYPNGDHSLELDRIVLKSDFKTAAIVENRWLSKENIDPFRLTRITTGPINSSKYWLMYRLIKARSSTVSPFKK